MEIWTGLACLVADPKCEGFRRFWEHGKGAYVNVVAWASSETEFAERVKMIVPTLDCILRELEGVQLLDTRMEDFNYPEELITMRATAERQRSDVVFGAFHTWTQNDFI